MYNNNNNNNLYDIYDNMKNKDLVISVFDDRNRFDIFYDNLGKCYRIRHYGVGFNIIDYDEYMNQKFEDRDSLKDWLKYEVLDKDKNTFEIAFRNYDLICEYDDKYDVLEDVLEFFDEVLDIYEKKLDL
jgi:hypothetical protein